MNINKLKYHKNVKREVEINNKEKYDTKKFFECFRYLDKYTKTNERREIITVFSKKMWC